MQRQPLCHGSRPIVDWPCRVHGQTTAAHAQTADDACAATVRREGDLLSEDAVKQLAERMGIPSLLLLLSRLRRAEAAPAQQ